MKLYHLAVVLLRVYAITLLIFWIGVAASTIPLFWAGPEEKMMGSAMTVRVWGIVDSTLALCVLGVAAFLLLRTEIVARFVCRGLPGGEEASVSARDLAVLGFSILGLYCFIGGVPGVAHAIVRWRTGHGFEADRYFVGAAVQAGIGLLLFVTPHGFVRFAHWVRRAGASEPASPPTPPA